MSTAATPALFSGARLRPTSDDVAVTRVHVFGTRAWMVYRRDEAECRRRRRHGLGALAALDVLDLLMNLPAGMPVPRRSLSAADRRLLGRVPAGAVTVSDTTVTRRIVPAVIPLLAIVYSTRWHDGLVAASRFAAYCRRMVVVPELPGNQGEALAQASLYGIGVAVGQMRAPEVLVEPEPFTDWQPTPAWWRFSEDVYRQVVNIPN